jgi:hypothetical protein
MLLIYVASTTSKARDPCCWDCHGATNGAVRRIEARGVALRSRKLPYRQLVYLHSRRTLAEAKLISTHYCRPAKEQFLLPCLQ